MQTEVTVDLLLKMDRPLPRYTSYPTAPEWSEMSAQTYLKVLRSLEGAPVPLSLYVHIPFCHSMCLYCGCSVVLNRKAENEERYVVSLMREIDLVAEALAFPHPIRQLHFGGGTPTKLSMEQLTRLMHHLQHRFVFDKEAELAIEIDPRTVVEDEGEKLRHLRKLGFNRVSFGVQDTDPLVQQAVKRHQSYEMTKETYLRARALGFEGINVDLIYGLPHQTVLSFTDTVEKIGELRPDRIALFSYAKVPWLKPHQKAIREETLPSTQEKFAIYVEARRAFLSQGYLPIGMDHFALPTDTIACAYEKGTLQRNFQGYTVNQAEEMVGLGMSAIGSVGKGYFQNARTLPDYYQALDQGLLPIQRGLLLSSEDLLRRFVIQSLMCHFYLDKVYFAERFGCAFDEHFAQETASLKKLEEQGLLSNTSEALRATLLGQLFIRHVAAVFDAYLSKGQMARFSQAV